MRVTGNLCHSHKVIHVRGGGGSGIHVLFFRTSTDLKNCSTLDLLYHVPVESVFFKAAANIETMKNWTSNASVNVFASGRFGSASSCCV